MSKVKQKQKVIDIGFYAGLLAIMALFLFFILSIIFVKSGNSQDVADPVQESCNKSMIEQHCWIYDNANSLRCFSANELPRFHCYYEDESVQNVTTLSLTANEINVLHILTFTLLPKLRKIEIIDVPNPIDIGGILLHLYRLGEIRQLTIHNSKFVSMIDDRAFAQGIHFSQMRLTNLQLKNILKRHSQLEVLDIEFTSVTAVESSYFINQPVKHMTLRLTKLPEFTLLPLKTRTDILEKLIIIIGNDTVVKDYNPYTLLRYLDWNGSGSLFPINILKTRQNGYLPLANTIIIRNAILPENLRFNNIRLQNLKLFNVTGALSQVLTTLPVCLEVLEIHNSVLTTIDASTFSVINYLKKLVIVNSSLTSISMDFLNQLSSLITLDLSQNSLHYFGQIGASMRQLKFLNLSNNEFSSFSLKNLRLPKIETIDLSNNRITALLDSHLGYDIISKALMSLNFSNNELVCSCQFLSLIYDIPRNVEIIGFCQLNHTSLYEHLATTCEKVNVSRSQRSIFDPVSPNEHNNNPSDTLNDTELWNTMNTLRFGDSDSDVYNQIRPNYGVGFSHEGKIVTGVENFMVHINLIWPTFELPRFQWNLESFRELCHNKDSLVVEICNDFVPLVKEAIDRIDHYSEQLSWKMDQISDLFGFQLHKGSSKSRSIRSTNTNILDSLSRNLTSGLLQSKKEQFNITIDDSKWKKEDDTAIGVSVIFPGAGSAYSASIRAKRDKLFKKALFSLVSRQDLLKGSFFELRKDLIMGLNIIADTFRNTSRNIQTLHELLNETNQEVVTTISAVEESLNILQQKVYGIRVLSVLTTKYLQLWAKQVHQYQILNQEADKLFSAITKLTHGKLSPYLVPPEQIRRLIVKATNTLNSWHNDYELVFSNLANVYEHSNVVFLPTERGFVIQLLWPIKAKDAKVYNLFRVSSVHVPVTTTPSFEKQEVNHDFSKVNIIKPYLGVATNNFVELSSEELKTCLRVDSLHLCFDTILELDSSKRTCNTAIFLNVDNSEIIDVCDIEYFFEPFLPVPTTVDVGDQLLVSGLTLPWIQRCSNDRIPRKMNGSLYAVLNKTSLCHCSISAPNGFIPRRITGCPSTGAVNQPRVVMTYAINSLVTESFREEFNFSDFSAISNYVMSNFSLPKLNISERVATTRLLNITTGSVKLKELSRVIKQKGDDFMLKWNEIAGDVKFASWFTKSNWPKAVTFGGAICGYIGLCLTLFLVIKGQYQQGFLQSLMFASIAGNARADEINDIPTCHFDGNLVADLNTSGLLKIIIIHFAIMIVHTILILILPLIARLVTRESRIMRCHPELRRHPSVEIFLEIHSGSKRILLYVMTFKAHLSKLHFNGQLIPSSLTIDHHKMYSLIRINWDKTQCSLKLDDLVLELPTIIHVPLLKRKKLQSIMKNNFQCSMIATDGLYLYKLGSSTHEVMAEPTANPYSNLIKELRQREIEFQNNIQSEIGTCIVDNKDPTAPPPHPLLPDVTEKPLISEITSL